jgi:poly-beta-1,6-N-acetyl-D-glucosamine synthase
MKKLCFIVPAHNEAMVLEYTINSILKLVPKEDIYIVSDGSIDQTVNQALNFTPNVLDLQPNRGKATALNLAISHFNLAKKYDFIMPMDADTAIAEDFIEKALPIFEKDVKREIACVVGKVMGKDSSWTTTYRWWEYEINQMIHKEAQDKESAVVVCPGCTTMFRSSIFNKVQIPTGTLTEDMDLTFLIHRLKLGKIIFMGDALVITQDPKTLIDYLKQVDRWYTGFWQCVYKHNVPWMGQVLDLEVSLLALEGLFNGFLVLAILLMAPLILLKQPQIFIAPFVIDLLFFMLPSILFISLKFKTLSFFRYFLSFYPLRFLSSFVFIKSFIKVSLSQDLRMKWAQPIRYEVR